MNADMHSRSEPITSDRLPDDQVELAVEIFRMLADGTRVRLLWALVDAELSVSELAAATGKAGPAVSQHLAKLRMARLVRTRREGNQVFYRLENDHVAHLVRDGLDHADHATDGVPAHHRGAARELGIRESR
jgi:DNA-binding transcriptional ArsR family regulator